MTVRLILSVCCILPLVTMFTLGWFAMLRSGQLSEIERRQERQERYAEWRVSE